MLMNFELVISQFLLLVAKRNIIKYATYSHNIKQLMKAMPTFLKKAT